jgi:hypothetical protein
VGELGLCLCVPGLTFVRQGHLLLGYGLLIGYLLSGITFLAGLGLEPVQFWALVTTVQFQPGFVAYGLMVAIHAISVLRWAAQQLGEATFRQRAVAAVGITFVTIAAVYWPVLSLIERRLLLPLQTENGTVVLQRWVRPSEIHKGDVIAYTMPASRSPGVYVQAGYMLGLVLAEAGDTLRFTPRAVEVNGTPLPRQPRMPVRGELKVAKEHWFIWPTLTISGGRNATAENITDALSQAAMVSQTQLVGKPFQRWFGREQPLP